MCLLTPDQAQVRTGACTLWLTFFLFYQTYIRPLTRKLLSWSDSANTLARTGTRRSAPHVEEELLVIQVVASVGESPQRFPMCLLAPDQAQVRAGPRTLCLWRDFLAVAPAFNEGVFCNIEWVSSELEAVWYLVPLPLCPYCLANEMPEQKLLLQPTSSRARQAWILFWLLSQALPVRWLNWLEEVDLCS